MQPVEIRNKSIPFYVIPLAESFLHKHVWQRHVAFQGNAKGFFVYATCLFQPLLRCKSHVDGFGQIAEESVSHPCRAADWWLESNVMGGPYWGVLCLLPIVKNKQFGESVWNLCLLMSVRRKIKQKMPKDQWTRPNPPPFTYIDVSEVYVVSSQTISK